VLFEAAAKGDHDLRGKRVGIIVCGGNVDLDRLPWQA
jgi:threonine dehydratase